MKANSCLWALVALFSFAPVRAASILTQQELDTLYPSGYGVDSVFRVWTLGGAWNVSYEDTSVQFGGNTGLDLIIKDSQIQVWRGGVNTGFEFELPKGNYIAKVFGDGAEVYWGNQIVPSGMIAVDSADFVGQVTIWALDPVGALVIEMVHFNGPAVPEPKEYAPAFAGILLVWAVWRYRRC